jgi:molecular chaperone GrpE
VASLLPVLDTLDQARAHADLAGFEAAAQELHERLGLLGLRRFGAVGDAFDPSRHEAVTATESADVDGPTCTRLLRPGYRLGERVLRPAHVDVTQPTTTPAGAAERATTPHGDTAADDLGQGGAP